MTWSKIDATSTVPMPGLVAFMERWRPGTTLELKAASPAQIASLAAPHGGVEAMPRVYVKFLETMGESMGGVRLTRGTTSISELIDDRADEDRRRPDPRRYIKFSIGEDDYNGRQPDDFLDLASLSADGGDAAIIRVHEHDLVSNDGPHDSPFATFSDLLRAVVVSKLGLHADRARPVLAFGLGTHPATPAKAYEFLLRLGFAPTELGTSPHVMPLEDARRGAIALLTGVSTRTPSTLLRIKARDKVQESLLKELVTDHERDLTGV